MPPEKDYSAHQPEMATPPPTTANTVAAIASFFIPGLGQLVQGRIGRGVGFFFAASISWIILLGWIFHIWAAVDASNWDGT